MNVLDSFELSKGIGLDFKMIELKRSSLRYFIHPNLTYF